MALLELAKAKRTLVETKKRIKILERDRYDATAILRSEETQGIDVNRHRIFSAYLRGLSHQIVLENDRLEEIGKTIRERQRAFEAERIKRESLELLRKKEHARFLKEFEQAEQKAADELMSIRWRSEGTIQRL
jgi:flagellar export protein FliJ